MTLRACLPLATTLVALGLGAVAPADAQDRYARDESWPHYPADMTFEMGTGVAVDAAGVVYTISRDVDHWAAHPLAMTRYRGRGTIARWDRTGRFLGTFADEQAFIGPHSIYVDPEGFVWVADREGHQVVKLTPEGEAVLVLGEPGVYGDDDTHFNGPTGVAFLPDGRIVVSDGYWNSRLVWFDADGSYLQEIGELGNGPGQLGAAHAVALGPDGRLYVANVCGTNLHEYVTKPGQIAPERHTPIPGCQSRFDVFTEDGDYLGPWEAIPEPGLPLSIAAYGDRLYAGVTGSRRGRQDLVVVDAETQQVVDRLSEANVYVHQMAMAPSGDVYVASVYPEHGGEARGIEGPSFVRWARSDPSPAPTADPVPRTSNGRPDLQGVWHFNTTTPLQRPALLGDRSHYTEEEHAALTARASEARPWDRPPADGSVGSYNQFWWDRGGPVGDRRTSLIVDPADGRLPALTPAARRQVGSVEAHVPGPLPVRYRIGGTSADGPEARGLAARCLLGYNVGPPLSPGGYNNNLQLFQSAQYVVILTEMVHDARIVPLDGRPHAPGSVPLWNGDARGRWEGDTLVVESTNFTARRASFELGATVAFGTGATLRLIERFTRVDADTLRYEYTVDDPATFTAPFTAVIPLARSEDPIYEYACHEGNYGMTNMLVAGRAADPPGSER